MYLTHAYLVNSFFVGSVKKKLKSMGDRPRFSHKKRQKVGTLLSSMVNHPYRN